MSSSSCYKRTALVATSRVNHPSFNAFFRSFNVLRALCPRTAVAEDCHRCVAKVERRGLAWSPGTRGLDAEATDTVIHDASNMTTKSPRREPSLFACTRAKRGCVPTERSLKDVGHAVSPTGSHILTKTKSIVTQGTIAFVSASKQLYTLECAKGHNVEDCV